MLVGTMRRVQIDNGVFGHYGIGGTFAVRAMCDYTLIWDGQKKIG